MARQILSSGMAVLLALPSAGLAQNQAASRLVVNTVSNSIKLNIGSKAPAPSVRVLDENGRPVPEATVTFSIVADAAGPSASFPGGAKSLGATTDARGDAVAPGLNPNQVPGRYRIEIQAQKPTMLPPEAPVSIAAENALEIQRLVMAPGEAFVNNLCKNTAGEPKVQVRDEQGKPVIGADVTFRLPATGASGVFAGGSATKTVTTDDNGQAVATGLVPNKTAGDFKVEAVASLVSLRANTVVAGSTLKPCFPTLLVVLGAAGAAGLAAALASRKGSSTTTTPTAPTPPVSSISIGSGGDPRFGGGH